MSKMYLKECVAELSCQLQGNEEKLTVYERRGSTSALANGGAQPEVSGADHLCKEQHLKAEVAELDLANAQGHVQQFQEISQATEVVLAGLNATYDDCKSSTESQLAKHESDYNALSENLHVVQQELTASREVMTETKRTFDKEWES
ncbi:hypothetical protein HETIRDRAFT_108753 [Heterobasidion irregulare TC 32-1]|uniref:Uncharacterized protein n=1 Tax=Heterobasidion irregulare (strain TC 32-1) TaxID=747525 RepID=W4K9P9_HETIT|nr:uncharacterized protein HETIRDRAFT_108753 [Heterobasidion irregulare TC 32-1]ETW82479.1 hypothetical protein HETIRDRAFT_108753 [Heterobasidion irregulare TC 32-1]